MQNSIISERKVNIILFAGVENNNQRMQNELRNIIPEKERRAYYKNYLDYLLDELKKEHSNLMKCESSFNASSYLIGNRDKMDKMRRKYEELVGFNFIKYNTHSYHN